MMVAPCTPNNNGVEHKDDENDVGVSVIVERSHRAATTSSSRDATNGGAITSAPTWLEGMVKQQTVAKTTTERLEERVQELEQKLATLSLVLQQQRRNPQTRSISPSTTPPPSPKRDSGKRAMPALDSPAPPDRHSQTRNLSFRMLYEDHTSEKVEPQMLFIPDGPMQSELELKTKCPEQPTSALNSGSASAVTSDEAKYKDDHTNEGDGLFREVHQGRKRSDSINTVDVRSKWLDYLNSFQESTHDVDQQMEEFIKVPGAVESLLSYGFWICVDSFLYLLTILPIRFVWSCLLLINHLLARIFNWKSAIEGPFRFHRRHVYQLIQVGIIYSVYKYVLMPVSIGKLYHWIRGQSMVKLYVLIAIVEVFDRLMCSLGQDCLDSLYWNTTRRPKGSRMIISILVVLVYTTVHSCLLFIHVATLNVAMNSADQALLTLLISGNFAEIKSTVFKKYNKPNLFKITAGDICERFKLALFLGLVLILNVAQGMDQKMVWSYIQMCGIVWCAEWLADWIKHSFITKFNFLPSSIYPEYALVLAGDMTGFGHEGVNLDHSHAVVRRIGLAQLPLVCVMSRYVREAIKYASNSDESPFNWKLVLGMFILWALALVWKVSLGSFLQRISQAKLKDAPALLKSNAVGIDKKNKQS